MTLSRKIPFFVLPALAVAAVVLVATGRDETPAAQQPPPPTVTVAPVEQRELVEWSEFTGRTEAVNAVEVRPRVVGYIQEVRFHSGQLVKKGDVLFVIDPRWHQAEFDRRKADVERARVQLENARREADRAEQLLRTRAISTEEGDTRTARFHEAQAALLAAEAARDFAQLDLEHTEVRAPIDGRVSRALLTEGNYVVGGTGEATLLTTIVSVNPVHVYADVDEESLLRFNALVSAGKLETTTEGRVPVELQLADETGFPHKGFIESFDNHLDPNTGSILLRAVVPNPDGRIVPGLFARLRIPLSARGPAMLVPEAAIGTDQAQKFVFTLTPSNTVAYQTVELGPTVDGQRIIRSGVQTGDKIVVNGLQRIRPGVPVTPQDQDDSNPVRVAHR
jgi:RND family efflux transporter MFP subunit